MIKAIEVCEGDLGDIHEFKTMEECSAFSDGFTTGANRYGAGGASIWTVEDIDEELADLDEFDEELLRKAKAKLEAYKGKTDVS